MRRRAYLGVIGVAAVLLIAAPSASAVQRFVAPGGTTSGNCTQTTGNPACDIEYAVEMQAQSGDEVIVNQGDYNLAGGSLEVPFALNDASIHGADGQARPRIISSAATGVSVLSPSTSLRRLAIEHTGSDYAVSMGFNSATHEQLFAHSTNGIGCRVGETGTLRDSVCWSNGSTPGLRDGVLVTTVGGGPLTTNLRNVTAIATGAGSYGISVEAYNNDTQQRLVGGNVIARGVAADVHAFTNDNSSPGPASALVILDHSNYVTESEEELGGSTTSTASVTDPGTGTNQIAAPLFADPANGDFHQLECSPTIDAGGDDGTLGSLDIDAEARFQGAAVDIGADETGLGCPPQAGDAVAPDTTITKRPKNKTKRKQATFEFSSSEPGSTFECRLDGGAFSACGSGQTFKVKKGKHSFEVRAKDAAGNVDATPATDAWKVRKKKR